MPSRIDAAWLPQGYSTAEQKGLFAQFYDDGQLAVFGYQPGQGESTILYLDRDASDGRVVRTTIFSHLPDLAGEIFEYEVEPDRFPGWAAACIEEICLAAGPNPRCAFCDKTREEVSQLIAGPRSYICNECIALCHQIIAEEHQHNAETP
jgi:hypothetical protein